MSRILYRSISEQRANKERYKQWVAVLPACHDAAKEH